MLCVTILIVLNVTVYSECCRIWSAIINCALHCMDVKQNGSKRQTVFVLKDYLEIAWDLNLSSWVPRYFPLKFPVTPFALKALTVAGQSESSKVIMWTNRTIHWKGTVSDIHAILTGRKKLLWIPTCPVVRKNSAENLAYIFVQSLSSKLPTVTTVVKLVSWATGGPHGALLKNYTILSQHTVVH